MDHKRPPQSLVVALYYAGLEAPYCGSVVLLDKNANCHLQYVPEHLTSQGLPKIKRSSSFSSLATHQNQKEYGAHLTASQRLPQIKRELKSWHSRLYSTYCVDLHKDYVAHIKVPPVPPGYPKLHGWTYCTMSADLCGADLCVVPDSGSHHFPIDDLLKGYLFNSRTKSFKLFQLRKGCRYYDHAVAVGEHIYFLAHFSFNQEGSFERYDPVNDLWHTLEPCPSSNYTRGVFAHAVWGDTIVLNVLSELWAYNIHRNKWYRVTFNNTERYRIVGVAVVLNNTIYALTNGSLNLVLALSIHKEVTADGDLKFYCSMLPKIVLQENEIVYEKREREVMWESKHMVLLGEDKFCIVQSCNSQVLIDYQFIQVTYIELKKGEINVADTFIYKLKLVQKEQFQVKACFSLPDSEAAALNKGKGTIFPFNPYPEDYASGQKDKNQEEKVPEVSTPPDEYLPPRNDVKGHYIYVRNLVKRANVKMVEERLKKFGAIKRDGIQVLRNKMGKGKHAIVEFECADSKKRAMEASPIKIGGFLAEILEKR